MAKTKIALFCERLSRDDNYRVRAAPPKIRRAYIKGDLTPKMKSPDKQELFSFFKFFDCKLISFLNQRF